MSALKELAENDGINALMRQMVPQDNPDAHGYEYQFEKCPEDMRGEVICAMAKVDGFIIGLSGTDITMHTMDGTSERGDRWFQVVLDHHHAVLWHLTFEPDNKPKTIH